MIIIIIIIITIGLRCFPGACFLWPFRRRDSRELRPHWQGISPLIRTTKFRVENSLLLFEKKAELIQANLAELYPFAGTQSGVYRMFFKAFQVPPLG